jgi:hypothetical protein
MSNEPGTSQGVAVIHLAGAHSRFYDDDDSPSEK